MPELNSQQQFDNIVNKYLENVVRLSDGVPEFEIRFGTRGIKRISKNTKLYLISPFLFYRTAEVDCAGINI